MAKKNGLTDQQHAIVTAISIGLNRDQAAAIGGISKRTIQRWMKDGREDVEADVPVSKSKFRRFYLAVVVAEAEFEQTALQGIAAAGAAGHQNWTAYAWLLERKWPERYGKREVVQLEGGDTPLVQLNLTSPAVRSINKNVLEELAQLPEVIDGEFSEVT